MQGSKNGVRVHPTAVVSAGAKLHPGVVVGPFCVIGEGVELGEGCRLSSHVVLDGDCVFGRENIFYSYASLGLEPPDIKFKGEASRLVVGDRNTFRESVTVHKGTESGGWVTKIGSDNLFLPYVHIGHDAFVGSHNIFVNNVALSGHVHCGNYVNLGGHTLVSPFCRIADFVHSSARVVVTKHVPAFLRLAGSPLRAIGVNTIGMQRGGKSDACIAAIKEAHKLVYKKGTLLKEVKEALSVSTLFKDFQEVRLFTASLDGGDKGIVR